MYHPRTFLLKVAKQTPNNMACAVKAMDRFNKVADARAHAHGMSMMVFSSATPPTTIAIDPNSSLVCKKCGMAVTHIASFHGDEQALCEPCATQYKNKWAGVADAVFVLTLDEVRALDKVKPRVKQTVDVDTMETMMPSCIARLPADVRAALTAQLNAPLVSEADMPVVCIVVQGCGCCTNITSEASLKTPAALEAALLLNTEQDDVAQIMTARHTKWAGQPRCITVYWENDSGGVMAVSSVTAENMCDLASDESAVEAHMVYALVNGLGVVGLPGWDTLTEPSAIKVQSDGALALVPIATFCAEMGATTVQEEVDAWAAGHVRYYTVSPMSPAGSAFAFVSRAVVTKMLAMARA